MFTTAAASPAKYQKDFTASRTWITSTLPKTLRKTNLNFSRNSHPMPSNLHDIRSRSGENAQMTRVERLLIIITPPPPIAAESRAGGVSGAFKRISAGRRVLTPPRPTGRADLRVGHGRDSARPSHGRAACPHAVAPYQFDRRKPFMPDGMKTNPREENKQ